MDHENNYASKGVGNTALTLAASSLGLQVVPGILGNLIGGNANNNAALLAEIAELKADKKQLESNIYNDQKSLDMYKYFDGRFTSFEAQLAQQAVYNATNTATLNCLSNQVAQLMSLTKIVIPAANICPSPTTTT